MRDALPIVLCYLNALHVDILCPSKIEHVVDAEPAKYLVERRSIGGISGGATGIVLPQDACVLIGSPGRYRGIDAAIRAASSS